MLTIHTL